MDANKPIKERSKRLCSQGIPPQTRIINFKRKKINTCTSQLISHLGERFNFFFDQSSLTLTSENNSFKRKVKVFLGKIIDLSGAIVERSIKNERTQNFLP